jgi:hypothetical protein
MRSIKDIYKYSNIELRFNFYDAKLRFMYKNNALNREGKRSYQNKISYSRYNYADCIVDIAKYLKNYFQYKKMLAKSIKHTESISRYKNNKWKLY